MISFEMLSKICTPYQIRTDTPLLRQIGSKCASLLKIMFCSVLLQILFISKHIANNIIQSLHGYETRSFTIALPFKLKRYFFFNYIIILNYYHFNFLNSSIGKECSIHSSLYSSSVCFEAISKSTFLT